MDAAVRGDPPDSGTPHRRREAAAVAAGIGGRRGKLWLQFSLWSPGGKQGPRSSGGVPGSGVEKSRNPSRGGPCRAVACVSVRRRSAGPAPAVDGGRPPDRNGGRARQPDRMGPGRRASRSRAGSSAPAPAHPAGDRPPGSAPVERGVAGLPRTPGTGAGNGGDRCGGRVGRRSVRRPRARYVGRRGSELPALPDHARRDARGRGRERGGSCRAAGRRRQHRGPTARPRHRLDAAGGGGLGGIRSAARLCRLRDHRQGGGLRRLRADRRRRGEGGRGDRSPAGAAKRRPEEQVRRQSGLTVRPAQPQGGQRLGARGGRGGVL